MQLWCATLILAIAFVASQAEASFFSLWGKSRNNGTRPNALEMLNEFFNDHVGPKDQLDVGIQVARDVIGFDVFEADQYLNRNLPVEQYRELLGALAGLGLANSKDAIRCSRRSLTNLKVLYKAPRRSKERVEHVDSLLNEYLASIQRPCYEYLASRWNQKVPSSIKYDYESFLQVFDNVNLKSYQQLYPGGGEHYAMQLLKGAIGRGRDWEKRSEDLIGEKPLRTMLWGDSDESYNDSYKAQWTLKRNLLEPCEGIRHDIRVRNVLDPLATLIELTGLENSQLDQPMKKNHDPLIWLARLLTCQQLDREGFGELYMTLSR